MVMNGLRAETPARSIAFVTKTQPRNVLTFKRLSNLIAMLALAGVAAPIEASNGLSDGGFDSEGANVSTYCYMSGSGCGSGPWMGSAALVHSGDPSWTAPTAPSPSTLVAIQGNTSIAQTFTATASGNFRVAWYEASRPNLGGQSYNVSINGILVATSSPPGTAFVRKTSNVFAMVSGTSYTITFVGTNTNGDHSAFIDSVDILSASDSATYNYDALGRLTTVGHTGAVNNGITSIYTLDPADNRSSVMVTGAGH